MNSVQEVRVKNPYQKYFRKLEKIVNKILNDRPATEDFIEFERLLKLGGLSDLTISGIYERCGFQSWTDYTNTKNGVCGVDAEIKVDCVNDKIRGAISSLKIVFSKKLYG